jgi:thiamine-phosphate pyrophosphorylase
VSARARAGIGGLHVLADDAPHWKLDPVEQAAAACAGGAAVVQLRAKRATDRAALAWAREIRRHTRACGALFIVNDRFDLALAAEADGVHLGQDDLPPERVPAPARRRLRIGRSTHTLEQLRAARDEPVDYVAFGPVFATRSKVSEYDARGLDALAAAVRAAAPRPLVAIGGIDTRNLARVLGTGAAGAAVISCVAGAADPVAATRELAAHWRRDNPEQRGQSPAARS